ncbi:MAG: TraX family protein [Eubacteriales bacterium]
MFEKTKIIDGSMLKRIAIISMTIDHVGVILFPQYTWLRIMGRLALPIFAFLIAEGMTHTKDVKKYILRLAAFALISEVPFDFAIFKTFFYINYQNIFFTLLLGALSIYIYQTWGNLWMSLVGVLVLGMCADMICADYGSPAVWLIFFLYAFRGRTIYIGGSLLVFNILVCGGIQTYGALALLPIMLYNGTRGKGCKYFFYWYYPIHLLLLSLI